MFTNTTGSSQTSVRRGFSDADTYGHGFLFAAEGSLDAPAYIPQGSVRLHNTMKQAPQQSHGHRDWDTGCKPIGAGHDGPEAATLWLDH